jgi:hypothetical protein
LLCALLPGYSRAELNQLLAATRTRHFAAGAWLSRDGAPGSSCFLIATGAVEVVKYLDGEEHVFATLRPGSLVGQTALVEGALRSASVRAISATTALEIRAKLSSASSSKGVLLPSACKSRSPLPGSANCALPPTNWRWCWRARFGRRAKRPATVDRLALAFIQAGTGEWDVPLVREVCPPPSSKKRPGVGLSSSLPIPPSAC